MVDWMPGRLRGLIARTAGIAPRVLKRMAHACGRGPPSVPQRGRFPLWSTHAKGSFTMNAAHQIQTLEISDAELDTVSGGLSPEASLTADSTTLSSADALSQLGAVQGVVLGALGQPHQIGVNLAF